MALKEENTSFSFLHMSVVEYQKNMDPSLVVHKNETKNVGKILFFITFLYTYLLLQIMCSLSDYVLIICFKQVF